MTTMSGIPGPPWDGRARPWRVWAGGPGGYIQPGEPREIVAEVYRAVRFMRCVRYQQPLESGWQMRAIPRGMEHPHIHRPDARRLVRRAISFSLIARRLDEARNPRPRRWANPRLGVLP